MDIDFNNFIQLLAAIGLGIIASFIGYQKLIKDWRSNNAETSVIGILHTEIERMSKQNTALSVELGRLHDEVINLTQQLQDLRIENQRLQIEVVALTNEVSIFKELKTRGTHG